MPDHDKKIIAKIMPTGVTTHKDVHALYVQPTDGTSECSCDVDKGCKITLNGKAAHLKDLLPGDEVILEGCPVKSIEATGHRDPVKEEKKDK